jgi:hypothetical protein
LAVVWLFRASVITGAAMNIFPQQNEPLFVKADLRSYLEGRRRELAGEIGGYEANKLLNTSPEDLATYFFDRFQVRPIELRGDQTAIDHAESRVDVKHDRDRFFRIPGPHYVPSTRVTFRVPFEGDGRLFGMQASTRDANPPGASIVGSEVHVVYEATEGAGAESIKATFERELRRIEQYLRWIAEDLGGFNQTLRQHALNTINERRKRILDSRSLIANLGFPLVERANAPRTYAVPEIRRKVVPIPPPATSAPFVPEPALEMAQYTHILSVLENMVSVIERSPSEFSTISEEGLRQHFLVQLNGQYDGAGSGETFNYEGKTDILLRVGGKNIFIAECKFWDGPASLTKALDQILSYASWRDTKVAVLVFNRGGNFSEVVAKIPGTMTAHPNYKRDLTPTGETRFKAIFRHRDDANRELTLTVAAFEVPAVLSPKAARSKKRKAS